MQKTQNQTEVDTYYTNFVKDYTAEERKEVFRQLASLSAVVSNSTEFSEISAAKREIVTALEALASGCNYAEDAYN